MRYWLVLIGIFMSVAACAEEKAADTTAELKKAATINAAAKNKHTTPAFSLEKYTEGVHYVKLLAPVPTIVDTDKIEVTEVFRFGCPACYHFEAAAKTWKANKPAAAQLVKNPVVWNSDTETRARVFYTGKKLGVGEETTAAIFKGIHEATSAGAAKSAYLKEDAILDLFVSLGITREKAKKMYNNMVIEAKVKQANNRARAFAISGTPEVFVDGRYRVIKGNNGTGFTGKLEVASFLVNKVDLERKAKAK